jgi:glycosyltransferase involved in cell wall biosynthesis
MLADYSSILCIPGPPDHGGLGRHSRCLMDQYPHARFVEPETSKTLTGMHFSFVQKIYNKFQFSRSEPSLLGFDNTDRQSAEKLQRLLPLNHVLCFAGCALRTFTMARRLGAKTLHLESPTAHISHCDRQLKKAYAINPLERCWLGPGLRAKILAEYQVADVIWVNSEYSRQTFLDQGFPESKLFRRYLEVDRRFLLDGGRTSTNEKFTIVYLGSVSVSKGVPVLLAAFQKIKNPKARLILIGGTGSRGMKQYVGQIIAHDDRISMQPGDPLPYLLGANVLVHPSWCDGFGLAPMEAMAAGVPVIVTQDTGMKDHVTEGVNGWVVPTGDIEALNDRLELLQG